jgi:ABC-type multidrug transport system ATPase subunit
MEKQNSIEIHNVSKEYKKLKALDKIDLEIKEGEILSIVGPNGSGKSTLLKLISGILTPEEGSIKVFDINFPEGREKIIKDMGVMFDSSSHWDELTGFENAWFFGSYYGIDGNQLTNRIEELFFSYGLTEKKDIPVKSYSYGMKRKLSFVETILHKPKIMLLDEPSIGLDYISRLRLYDYLKTESSKGATVIIATNDINEASLLSNRIVLVKDGKIVTKGTYMELISYISELTKIDVYLAYPINLNLFEGIEHIKNISFNNKDDTYIISIFLDNKLEALDEIIRCIIRENIRILRIDIKEPNLADVFLKLTGRDIDNVTQ